MFFLNARPARGAALLVLALSACGGGTSDEAVVVTTTVPAVTTSVPITTDPPIVVDATPALVTFGEAHGDLATEWSTQLEGFGDEAIEHLDDVSAAPSAATVADLSDQMIRAIGDDATDAGLVTLRDFATGISTAVAYSADGDQESALSVFLTLQSQADELTAVLDEIRS